VAADAELLVAGLAEQQPQLVGDVDERPVRRAQLRAPPRRVEALGDGGQER
jgi:hypothetical protein